MVEHPSLLLQTPQCSTKLTKVSLIIGMAVITVMGGFLAKITKSRKVSLIIVMGAARPVAGLKKAEIRHGALVSRKRKFAKLTGIWVWVRVHKKG